MSEVKLTPEQFDILGKVDGSARLMVRDEFLRLNGKLQPEGARALNPNHPTSKAYSKDGIWMSIAAVLLNKFGIDDIVLTREDVEGVEPGTGIAVRDTTEGVHLRLVDAATAKELAKEQGGLPV